MFNTTVILQLLQLDSSLRVQTKKKSHAIITYQVIGNMTYDYIHYYTFDCRYRIRHRIRRCPKTINSPKRRNKKNKYNILLRVRRVHYSRRISTFKRAKPHPGAIHYDGKGRSHQGALRVYVYTYTSGPEITLRRVSERVAHIALPRGGPRRWGWQRVQGQQIHHIITVILPEGVCVCGCAGVRVWVRVRVVRDCVFRFDESYVWDDSSAGTHSTL